MPDSNFTVRVPDDLKEAFTEAARAHDRTGAQLVREFMRNYIEEARNKQEYEDWFRAMVEAGMEDLRNGRVVSGEEVEKHFAARRAEALKRLQNDAS